MSDNPYAFICRIHPREQTAAREAIEKALLELYAQRDVSRISVKELCARASVARSTFYAYYGIVDDCLADIENRAAAGLVSLNSELLGSVPVCELDLDFIRRTVEYIQENQQLFRLFLVERPNSRFIEKWKAGIKYHLYGRMAHVGGHNMELTLEMLASEALGAYRYWLTEQYELDLEYVKKLLSRTLEAYTEQ